MTAADRLRTAAVTPIWLASTAGWALTSGLMLTWSAVQDRRLLPR